MSYLQLPSFLSNITCQSVATNQNICNIIYTLTHSRPCTYISTRFAWTSKGQISGWWRYEYVCMNECFADSRWAISLNIPLTSVISGHICCWGNLTWNSCITLKDFGHKYEAMSCWNWLAEKQWIEMPSLLLLQGVSYLENGHWRNTHNFALSWWKTLPMSISWVRTTVLVPIWWSFNALSQQHARISTNQRQV